MDKPIDGNLDFEHLKAIHFYLFQDLFFWAGKVRTVAIAKGNLFCLPQYIESYAKDIFDGQTLSYDFYESLKEKDSWDIKTYVLYGEKDKIVDQESIFNFISNHNSSLTIMKNGEHYFHTPGQLKFIKKWINEYLS